MDTVWELVAERARRAPDAVALRGVLRLTYRELVDRAAALDAEIRRHGAPGSLLAMELVTPATAAIVQLAAARSRCAVLPMNTDAPQAHRHQVLADARPALTVRETSAGEFAVDRLDGPARDGMTGVAYVIYTSGTTGRPKGVVVGHAALLSRLRAFARVPGFGADDTIVAMTAPSFDISVAETLVPLAVGGTVLAAPPGTGVDPAVFARAVAEHRPTVVQATPSFFRLALAWGWVGDRSLRLWCGGEALTPALAEKLLPRCAELWNVYGPTEATIWATAARMLPGRPPHLGDPLPGAGLRLGDADGDELTGPGSPGEILLYGEGLADGYLDRPELTADRFRTCRTPTGPRRCYRTGDQGRYRSDGTLEFLGRSDGQVKLRGHRIELAGLESVAEEQPGVSEAVAVLRDADDPPRAHIALHVVTDGSLTVREVRRWLAERLPGPARPGRVVIETALPRMASGKVDRSLLTARPEPERHQYSEG